MLDQADCVVIVPSVLKFAVGSAGSYGPGVMTCRGGIGFYGPWGIGRSTGSPTGLRFYGVCEGDGSLLIPFGGNRLLSPKEARPPFRTNVRDSLVAQQWS